LTTPHDDPKLPHPADIHVGALVRRRRKALGMNQTTLALATGLTFQQIQKYERGANRISASKLYLISKTLNQPISEFFDGLDVSESCMDPAELQHEGSACAFLASQEGVELASFYTKIARPAVRRKILDLVNILVAEG